MPSKWRLEPQILTEYICHGWASIVTKHKLVCHLKVVSSPTRQLEWPMFMSRDTAVVQLVS